MTTREKLPENAQEVPPIRSPEEDHERARKSREESERRISEGKRGISPGPDEPLRQPGELSEPPPEVPPEDR